MQWSNEFITNLNQIIEMSYPMLRKHNLYTTAMSTEFIEMSNQLAQDWNV